jgi:hypothetical protein
VSAGQERSLRVGRQRTLDQLILYPADRIQVGGSRQSGDSLRGFREPQVVFLRQARSKGSRHAFGAMS